jgi:hypothetical protein
MGTIAANWLKRRLCRRLAAARKATQLIAVVYIEIDRFVKDFLLDTDVHSVSRKTGCQCPLSGAIRFSHHSK